MKPKKVRTLVDIKIDISRCKMKPKNCKKGIEALIFAKYSLSVETKLINIDRNNMATIRKLAKGLHQIL